MMIGKSAEMIQIRDELTKVGRILAMEGQFTKQLNAVLESSFHVEWSQN